MARARKTERTGPARAVAYVRVSTGEQAESGAGLAAQEAAVRGACAARGWELAQVLTDAGASGKSLTGRPALAEALAKLADGRADVLVVAKLDRLSRSSHDATGLLMRAEREGWALVALDLGIDTSTPVGELVATMMSAVAQWERRAISERTRSALAARRAAGVRLGRPRSLPVPVVARIVAERAAGASTPCIASGLNRDGVPTAQGGARWWPATVAAVLRSAALDPVPA